MILSRNKGPIGASSMEIIKDYRHSIETLYPGQKASLVKYRQLLGYLEKLKEKLAAKTPTVVKINLDDKKK